MAKTTWPTLERTKTLAAPMAGRPVAFGARFAVSAAGTHVAVLDALPPVDENERDDRDLLRMRVFAHDGAGFTLLLEERPKKVGFAHGELRVDRFAVSNTGALAYGLRDDVIVLSPSGERRQISAPGATPFFDPIAPERVRLAVERDGRHGIETYDAKSGAFLGTMPTGSTGGYVPLVDTRNGDVLLADGWFAREDAAFVGIERNQPGQVVVLGSDVLVLEDDVEAPTAVRRYARDGSAMPVCESFVAWRRADPYRARAPMIVSADGKCLLARHGGKVTVFDANTLEKRGDYPAIAPRGTHLGGGILACLSEDVAIAVRFGLFLVDPRTGVALGDGPIALLGMEIVGDHVVTLHEDGIRVDAGAPFGVAVDPAIDGLRVAPDGRHAVVVGATGDFAAVVVDLADGREVARIAPVASAAWANASSLVVASRDGVRALDVATGAVTPIMAVAEACLASDGRGGFLVGTADAMIEHPAEGESRTRPLPKKKPKGYRTPTAIIPRGDVVDTLIRGRLFRWDGAGCERLVALEGAIGGPKLDPASFDGPLRSLAVRADGRWIAVTAKTKSHAVGVLLADTSGNIVAWTGPLFGRKAEWQERAWCAFRGDELIVATEHGDVGVYALPTA